MANNVLKDKSGKILNPIIPRYEKNIIYSTEEIIIGYVIYEDTKIPLYRKMFLIDNYVAFNSNKYFFNHNINNFGDLFHIYGSCYDTAGGYKFPLPYVGRGTADIMLNINNTQIGIEQQPYGNDRLKNFKIIVEYTKTTD